MNIKVNAGILVISFLVCIAAKAHNAPITSEMLTGLRAFKTVNASRPIVTLDENKQVVGIEETGDNASIVNAIFALKEGFNIAISREYHPEVPNDIRFLYSVTANERLVDALNNLVTATGNRICWRLLEGMLVVTEIENGKRVSEVQACDRVVTANIDGESIYDALLQLEAAYNEQHPDIPLLIRAPFYPVVQKSLEMKAENPALFVLAGSDTLRNHFLQLLDQFNQSFSDYSSAVYKVNPKHIALPWDGPELWYFHVRFIFPDLGECTNAAEHLWIFEEGDKHTERLEALFDRLEPGLLSCGRNFPGGRKSIEK
ncbi:MAG: hypothetical protein KAH38_02005 [Candidatus Hydrogenedentes bacterium]|nr:hypothetical protein [Candidatus Hydrogenedentota bacterium]